jgi:hypothetical protein
MKLHETWYTYHATQTHLNGVPSNNSTNITAPKTVAVITIATQMLELILIELGTYIIPHVTYYHFMKPFFQ